MIEEITTLLGTSMQHAMSAPGDASRPEEATTWQRQREALRVFQEAAAARAQREALCQQEFRTRAAAIEQEYEETQVRLGSVFQEGVAKLEAEAEQARRQAQEECDDGIFATEEEFEASRQQAL